MADKLTQTSDFDSHEAFLSVLMPFSATETIPVTNKRTHPSATTKDRTSIAASGDPGAWSSTLMARTFSETWTSGAFKKRARDGRQFELPSNDN